MRKTYTVKQFTQTYNLSRSTIYRLWRDGRGPRVLRVGRKVLITVEAAQEWARAMEAEAA